ncbi:MAG: NADH dehydrogenase [Rhizobiales bacterium NRL2]|jgi:NADH:ubiquinone oxidoreductase subunit|nr:MAG: NADH dehydrogenase [Rhizobiales bacterium NRL2]
MPNMFTRFMTWRRGRKVGEDQFGNAYYEDRKEAGRRWVVYKGIDEGSKVPPMWNAWLHHTIDEVPKEGDSIVYDWERPHEPNLTGTPHAYRPKGHVTRRAERDASDADYEAWSPDR